MAGHAADAVQAEHPRVDAADVRRRAHAEQHPADHDEQERHRDGGHVRQPPAAAPSMVRPDEQPAVVQAPRDEVQRRAVPEPAEAHRHEQVRVAAALALPVAAERDVEVVAQPGRERHVPPAPELRRARRAVRPVEVPRQLDPEHPREPERHVGVRAEVEVDLEAEADRGRPGVDEPDRAWRREVVVDPLREPVGEEHLLREAEREQQQSGANALGIEPLLPHQLRLEDPVADDRAGDQMREERDEERVAQQIALGAQACRGRRRPGTRCPRTCRS